MLKVKIRSRSPIELFWTAKNLDKTYQWHSFLVKLNDYENFYGGESKSEKKLEGFQTNHWLLLKARSKIVKRLQNEENGFPTIHKVEGEER